MRPKVFNRILLQEELTPEQKEMLNLEEKNDKGYDVNIKDVKHDWKFEAHPDPAKGLDLEYYDKEANIPKFDIDQMFQGKELKPVIQTLTEYFMDDGEHGAEATFNKFAADHA